MHSSPPRPPSKKHATMSPLLTSTLGSPEARVADPEWMKQSQYSAMRYCKRSESVPALIRRGSITFGKQQDLKGVTAFDSEKDIAAALQMTQQHARHRLQGLSFERRASESMKQTESRPVSEEHAPPLPPAMSELSPATSSIAECSTTVPQYDALPPAVNEASPGAYTNAFSFGSAADDTSDGDIGEVHELDLLRSELEDRENQILQAVDLGAGLLQQLGEEREAAAAREAELQAGLDKLVEDTQGQTTKITEYKTTIMYLLNCEEELVSRSIENIMLQKEVETMGNKVVDSSTTAWMQDNLKKDAELLGEREKEQREQQKELTSKLKEVNGWKGRAARCDKLGNDLVKSKEDTINLEREVRRLTRLLHEREASLYGLKQELANQSNTWSKETAESSLNRLKRENLRLKQEVENYQASSFTAEQDAKQLRALLSQHSDMPDNGMAEQKSYVAALQRDALSKMHHSIEHMKEEFFAEMSVWMIAVTDVARDNRRQGDVLKRLRNENTQLKDRVRTHEQTELENSRGTARSRLVNSCQLINKELHHIRDYSKGVKGQAAIRNITEKEFLELSSGLSSVCKLFLGFLQQLLSPSEKQLIGISLTDTTGAGLLDTHEPNLMGITHNVVGSVPAVVNAGGTASPSSAPTRATSRTASPTPRSSNGARSSIAPKKTATKQPRLAKYY